MQLAVVSGYIARGKREIAHVVSDIALALARLVAHRPDTTLLSDDKTRDRRDVTASRHEISTKHVDLAPMRAESVGHRCELARHRRDFAALRPSLVPSGNDTLTSRRDIALNARETLRKRDEEQFIRLELASLQREMLRDRHAGVVHRRNVALIGGHAALLDSDGAHINGDVASLDANTGPRFSETKASSDKIATHRRELALLEHDLGPVGREGPSVRRDVASLRRDVALLDDEKTPLDGEIGDVNADARTLDASIGPHLRATTALHRAIAAHLAEIEPLVHDIAFIEWEPALLDLTSRLSMVTSHSQFSNESPRFASAAPRSS